MQTNAVHSKEISLILHLNNHFNVFFVCSFFCVYHVYQCNIRLVGEKKSSENRDLNSKQKKEVHFFLFHNSAALVHTHTFTERERVRRGRNCIASGKVLLLRTVFHFPLFSSSSSCHILFFILPPHLLADFSSSVYLLVFPALVVVICISLVCLLFTYPLILLMSNWS